jgi:hypothetical protein
LRTVTMIALALLVVGGINWGLVGLLQLDLVAAIFGGPDAGLARIVYILVGISAVICIGLFRYLSSDHVVGDTTARVRP